MLPAVNSRSPYRKSENGSEDGRMGEKFPLLVQLGLSGRLRRYCTSAYVLVFHADVDSLLWKYLGA